MPRPNLLLITTDQQRGDCMGSMGHPVQETPYLDELAENGALFTRAYSAVPSCTPARAAILTGMDQWNHGRLTMAGSDSLEFPATLPGVLADAGYHTQAVGKMHHAPQRKLYGFHHMVLEEAARREGGFISDYHAWFEQHKQGEYGDRDHSVDWNSWMARPSHLPEHLHPTYWTAGEGVNFVKRRDPSKPFFLWLSFHRPHSPYDPPQVYYDMYDGRDDIPEPSIGDWAAPFDRRVADVNAPRTRRSDLETRRARAAYYGSVTFIDHQIGRFLYEFKRFDPVAFRNTLIIFTSDHGDMLGDHHHWRKTYAYEGSAHVPFLISFPSGWNERRGQKLEHLVEMRDIMPTMLDAAGVDSPPSVDGKSLLPLLRGEGGTPSEWRAYIQGEHTMCYGKEWGMQFMTDGREKYIWFHHTGKEQLFDLAVDPGECRDLSQDAKYETSIERWRRELATVNEERGDPRGEGGRLVPQPEGALTFSPNYVKWKSRAEALEG